MNERVQYVLKHILQPAGRWIARLLTATQRLFPASHYVLLSLLFVVGLELIFALQRWVILVAVGTVVLMIIGVILVRVEEAGRFRLQHVILPVLATTGLSGFAFLLPTSGVLHVYVLLAGLLFFLLLKHGARHAYPLWNWALTLAIYFFNLAFILGLRFHLYLPILVMLSLVAIVTFLVAYQALARILPKIAEGALPVLGITFVLTEVVWTLQFLPSHYLVQAGLVSALYYVIFNLVSISYMRGPTRSDIIEYVGVGGIATLLIIITARWT